MGLIDEFKFPKLDEASTEFLSQDFQAKTVDGIGSFQPTKQIANELPRRFFILVSKKEHDSELTDMEINEEIPMIEWFKDKKHKPTARVTDLPEQLLKFSRRKVSEFNGVAKWEYVYKVFDPIQGKELEDVRSVLQAKGLFDGTNPKLICKGGLYREDFIRFQEGLGMAGLPLDKWGRLSMSEVKTFNSEGIFTVQQLAAYPSEKAESSWPKQFRRWINEAIHFCNAEDKRAEITPFVNELIEQKKENQRLKESMEQLKAQMASLVTPKKRGRPKKVESLVESTEQVA